MKKNLIMVTKMFPYSNQETFIESEITIASKIYDRILIIAYQVSDFNMREVPHNVSVLPLKKVNRLKKIFYYIRDSLKGCLRGELVDELKKAEGFAEKRKVFSFYCEVCLKERQSRTFLENYEWNEGTYTFYSYWLLEPAYLAMKLREMYKENTTFISRAHGYDLYKARNNGKEFPFREIILKKIDKVYACSQEGEKYLRQEYPMFSKKITYSYLGTRNVVLKSKNERKMCNISIVTCSNLIPIKRVERLAQTLRVWEQLFNNISISWVCFGDGIMRDEVETYCLENLKKTKVVFQGNRKNCEILKYYEENSVDLFISLSESEGVPVSLMEASSYGIPIIATKVGGTPEIVTDGKNGYLLSADFSNRDLIDVMEEWYLLSDEEKCEMRASARRTWENLFQAEKNYEFFYQNIENII